LLVFDVDGFSARLEEGEPTVEDVGVNQRSNLVVDELDGNLFMYILLEEQRVTVLENVLYLYPDGQYDHGHDEGSE